MAATMQLESGEKSNFVIMIFFFLFHELPCKRTSLVAYLLQ